MALKKKYEIERSGEKIVVPPAIPLPEAVETLQNQIQYEEQEVNVAEAIDCAFLDGAFAFSKAMERRYGYVHAAPAGFFDSPPQLISVNVGVGKTAMVPWGRFKVAKIKGIIATGITLNTKKQMVFQISATVKRKDAAEISTLADLTRKIAKEESIYRGKAIRVRFCDDDGDPVQPFPEPVFMDVSKATVESLILSKRVGEAVHTSIFTPIIHTEACRKAGVPLKRGVLLSGMYGTGKTKAAHTAAMLCEKNGWSFIYCERANELEEAVRFAQIYTPAVIFCEDVDRVTAGERDIEMDALLDIIDGIESKDNELMVVLTTNNVRAINKAMIRPGRLDDVIEFTAPDAEAVERLIRHYAGDSLAKNTDLEPVCSELSGNIPAVIRECVERAKLSQIKLSLGDVSKGVTITGEALLDASYTMSHQLTLLNSSEAKFSRFEALGRLIGEVSAGRATGGVQIDGLVAAKEEGEEELRSF